MKMFIQIINVYTYIVEKNLLVSLPVFFSASITYLITPLLKIGYQYPWFIYVH